MSDHAAMQPPKEHKWQAWISLAATVLMVLVLVFLALRSTNDKNNVEQKNDQLIDTSLNLAEQVKRACAQGGQTAKDLGSACGQANAVITQPAIQKGERGLQGRPGLPGPQGTDGKQGPRGLPGKNGKDGAKGAPGSNGADGAAGANGADGATGSSGPPGPQGDPGPAGKDGTDGADGKNGTDGRDGTSPSTGTCRSDGVGTGTFTCTFDPPPAAP